MSMNFSSKSLSEAVGGNERISGGPFGSKLTSSNYCEAGIPVIRGSNMEQNGRWLGGDFAFVSADRAQKEYKSNMARPGDVIVTQRGTLGQVSIVPNIPYNEYVISQSQMAISPNMDLADSLFVYYYLKSPQFCSYADSQIIQTGVPHINLGILRNAPCTFPDITKQTQVASVLGALDDKIDLNRRTNETLEAMARALFRDWFVDFGPTRAKMAGQAPYLAPEIWELFPDRLDDEGKPEGWNDSLVGRQFDVTMGQSPPGDTYNPDGIGIPFYQGKTDFGAVFPQRRMYCTAPTRFANTLDSLVSVRAPVGDVNLSEEKCCIGRGLASVRHPQNLPYYTYFTMKFLRDVFSSFESNGTVFGSINKKQFEELSVIESGFEKLFERQVMPTCSKIVANETENRNLAELRDLLLPKLMSGEIRVRDAEKMVADAL